MASRAVLSGPLFFFLFLFVRLRSQRRRHHTSRLNLVVPSFSLCDFHFFPFAPSSFPRKLRTHDAQRARMRTPINDPQLTVQQRTTRNKDAHNTHGYSHFTRLCPPRSAWIIPALTICILGRDSGLGTYGARRGGGSYPLHYTMHMPPTSRHTTHSHRASPPVLCPTSPRSLSTHCLTSW